MASSSPLIVAQDDGESKSLLRRVAVLTIHTLVVYTSAVRLSPWLVYHWFGWIAPIIHATIRTPATDWYLRHLELVTIIPALVVGYINVTRFLPRIVRSYLGESNLRSAAVWSWVIPVIVLAYEVFNHRPHSSVLYGSTMWPIEYLFDIQKVMPNRSNFSATDPVRVLTQMIVTAPFYAGVAYSLGALASKHRLLTKLFVFEERTS
jgi:hypothetical protein